jgi:hypothetical protein
VIARPYPAKPSFDSTGCRLEQIRSKDEDRALITVIGRVTYTVFVIARKNDGCHGVDDDGLGTPLENEDAAPWEADLSHSIVLGETVAGSRRSAHDIERPDDRGLDQQVRGLVLSHGHVDVSATP